MKKIIPFIQLLFTIPVLAMPLTFKSYPAKIYHGTLSAPNFSSKDSKHYRTVIDRAAKSVPNFGGHYKLIPIGAGAGTILLAVLDSKNGAIVFPKTLPIISWADWWHEPYGPQFHLDSNLLIAYGRSGNENAPCGVSYYKWLGNDFQPLKFELKDCGQAPS